MAELDAELSATYPPEQRHGLSFAAIFQQHVRFFVARLDGTAVGCGGVALFPEFAEVKRMYVGRAARGHGVAQAVLRRIEAEARGAGLPWLRLETGDAQAAALRLYEAAGFWRCTAFGEYRSKPAETIATSVFMEKPVGGDDIACT